MKKLLAAFVGFFVFWLCYFIMAKIIFLLYNVGATQNLTVSEITGIFFHGIKMDLSMTGYLMVIPGLFFSVSFFIKPRYLLSVFNLYTYLILSVITFLSVLDLGLYPHWGTRVGISAFNYINDPEEMIANVTWWQMLMAVVFFSLNAGVFIWLYNRFLKKAIFEAAGQKWFFMPVLLFLTAFLFLPIRGGLGTAPINFSSVSFSPKLYVNQASYNYLWHFLKTLDNKRHYKNPCKYFTKEDALERFYGIENQRTQQDSLILDIDVQNPPNVLLVILESFSNKLISSFGGKYGVCPNIDSISKSAIKFTSFYASGNRSDRGLSAIIGGYPSLLTQSIANFPDKSDKLTMISDYFNRNGYTTSFYYGGDIDFYNLKSFVLQGDFKNITGRKEFPAEIRNLSSWGAPDEYLFNRALSEINTANPFFTVIYTLSSHPPYDVPFSKIKGTDNESKYLNSVAYTDSCLGAFINDFRKTPAWENTLVIITADHGALFPGPTEINEPATYRIPMIWTGGVVKNPANISIIGGQPDLIPTLVSQFGWKTDPALFGHNLFSEPSYAFYMYDSGWGYITQYGEYFFDNAKSDFIKFSGTDDPTPGFDFAKAYLQVLHTDFLKK